MSGVDDVVFVVDDDPSVRKSITRLLRSAGYRVVAFAGPEEFLSGEGEEAAGARCAVLDVELPGITGIELQERLDRSPVPLPIVFITGHGDIPMGVEAMKRGAVDFLPKPFQDQDLLGAVERGLARDREAHGARRDVLGAREALADLTPREHEVMRHVIAGMLNKQIASRLDIAEKTVKVHRGRVMEKSGAESVADLVRLCERAGIRPAEV